MEAALRADERRLLVALLTEANPSVALLARRLGYSKQNVHYWLRRLRELGLIGPPQVYVRPDVAGMYYLFFQADAPPDGDAVLHFQTLEGRHIFAMPARTPSEMEELAARYGRPWFVPNLKPRRLTRLQYAALMKFAQNPEISSADLERELGIPKTAARRLRAWIRNSVNVLYKVDLGRSNVVALAVRTRAPPALYAPHKFFKCYAYAIGFYAVAFPDLATAHQFVTRLKAADPKSEISVIADYGVKMPPMEPPTS